MHCSAARAATEADTNAPPRGPRDALQSLQARPGFTVELVASEPLVEDPVAFDWGPDGRLWVVEMTDYPLGIDGQGAPGGRIRLLEDTNADWHYDQSTVFAEGLPFPTGIMAWQGGVLVSAAPDILFLRDTTGDGRADHREVLYHGFGEGNQQHRMNGFTWGLDNWVHVANGDSGGQVKSLHSGQTLDIQGHDLRIRPADGSMDLQSGQTQFGRHRDDWGNWFGSNNSLPVRHYALADQYLRRNPHVRPPLVSNDIATTGNTQLFPISRVLSHFFGYQPPGPEEVHRFTSACSTVFYRDNLFGEAFSGDTFTCEPVHNLVHRRKLVSEGTTYRSVRPEDEQQSEFLASTDSWFRPTMVRTGPDGALWVADMYRLVIEHPEWIDAELAKQLDLRAGHDRGRIYRVYPAGTALRPPSNLDQLDTQRLVAALDSPNGWQRDTAQRLLVHRADQDAVTPLRTLARTSQNPLARLHALCTLDGLGAVDEPTLGAALADSHPGIRRHAVRLSEPFLAESAAVAAAIRELVDDPDPHVRLQLAYSLGASPHPEVGALLGKLLVAEDSDSYLHAAAFSALTDANLPAALSVILPSDGRQTAQAEQVLGPFLQLAAAMKSEEAIASAVRALVAAEESQRPETVSFDLLTMLLSGCGTDAAPDSPLLQGVAAPIGTFRQRARERATDEQIALETRVAAIRLLGQTHRWADAEEVELLVALLQPYQPIDVQQTAVNDLGRSNPQESSEAMLDMLAQMSPAIHAATLDRLLSTHEGTSHLLAKLETDTGLLPQIGAAYRDRLLSHQEETFRERARAVLGANDRDRRKVLEEYQECLAATGDATRGELVFQQQCATCHRVGNTGFEVGPDITALKDRSPRGLLTAILDPNLAVEDKYRSYLVVTAAGRAVSGIIVGETSTSVTLKTQNGKEEVSLRSEIHERSPAGTSLMPEGIEKLIGVDDMRHLLAYLRGLRPPARVFAGNLPQPVLPDDQGTLRLAATDCWIYGNTLEFEQKYRNLGFWSSPHDYAEWIVEPSEGGEYDVFLEYACDDGSAGATYALQIAAAEFTGEVAGTGTWDDYTTLAVGRVQLEPGTQTVALRPLMPPNSCLLDLKAIILRSATSTASVPRYRQVPHNHPEIVVPETDGTLRLLASQAELYGGEHSRIAIYDGQMCIGWWTQSDDYAVWQVEAAREGLYDVYLHWSITDEWANNSFAIEANATRIDAQVPTTGGFEHYQRCKFGQLHLKKGLNRVRMQPTGDVKGELADLKEIALVPPDDAVAPQE